MKTRPIYLDNCATTRTDPRVLRAMLPHFCEAYGNAASRSHAFGWEAEDAVEAAREKVAKLIGAEPAEVTWTSGATESNVLAVKGYALANRDKGNHVITCATEHKSILETVSWLRGRGYDVTVLRVDPLGRVAARAVEAALTDRTILVSLMWANNETGTLHPLREVARLCRSRGVVLHSDATQACGKIPVDVTDVPVDLLSLSAHKFYGPKGVGVLYVRRLTPRLRLEPCFPGGGQQNGVRGGTLPVPLIVGFGEAAAIAADEMPAEAERTVGLRDAIERGVCRAVPSVRVNGDAGNRLPGVTSLSFPGVDGEALFTALAGLAVSSGSACSSASAKPSHVLTGMGLPPDLAQATIRCSAGRFNTRAECECAVEIIARAVRA